MVTKKIVKDVLSFIRSSSEIVGNYEAELFDIDMWNQCQDYPIDSPIEQIFFVAFKTLMTINSIDSEPHEVNGKSFFNGVGIIPQKEIGKYRVDFFTFFENTTEKIRREVVVECDSQEFHERSEQERRYEKARDRFLQSNGYKVFRFTGKEIKDEPFRVARDVLAYLTGDEMDQEYLPEKWSF